MTKEELEQCRLLEESCELRSDADFAAYSDAIQTLRGRNDPEILRCFLRCFRDTESGEIQYELVEACEAFPDDMYVSTLLDEGVALSEKSPRWFRLLFQSILNTESCLERFMSIFPSLQVEVRNRYIRIVRELAADNPKYQEILDTLSRQS